MTITATTEVLLPGDPVLRGSRAVQESLHVERAASERSNGGR